MSIITGTPNNDLLVGTGANDSLTGGLGNDTLNGGAGDDTMDGGRDNDIYIVDSFADLIKGEQNWFNSVTGSYVSSGIDTVQTSLDSFSLGAYLENLVLTGAAGSGFGNSLANTIRGNSADNELAGYAGNDSLVGGLGNDALEGGAGNDTLNGGDGDDWLQAGSGQDSVIGGTGYDTLSYYEDSDDIAVIRGISVNLATGTAIDSWNRTDTLSGIEAVFGTQLADQLIGNSLGNDLNGRGGNDTISGGAGNDWLQPGPGNDHVDGGTGIEDSIVYQEDASVAATTRGVDVNLGTGIAIDSWNNSDTLVGIEWAFGSARADRLVGNVADNVLDGGGGNDTLSGGAGEDWLDPGLGNDSVDGGAGHDTLSYDSSEGGPVALRGANVNLVTGTAADPWNGTDSVAGIENVVGSALNDTLSGANDETLLDGRAGNDRLLVGGIVYSDDPAGVFVNISAVARTFGQQTVAAHTAHDGFGGVDILGSGVVSGYGSYFNDVWFGGNEDAYVLLRKGNDTVHLGSGNDWLQPGSGNDTVDGGGGFDGVSYEDDGFDGAGAAFQGVSVNLATGVAIDGWNGTDQLIGIEDIFGSALNDSLTGSAGGNYLEGGAGNDTINGGGGDDDILGGIGDDRVDGGAGEDFFAVSGTTLDDYNIVHNNDGSTTVSDQNLNDGNDGTDTLVNVELLGLAIIGGAGDDTISGGGIDATLAVGKDGNDVYVLKLAADHVVERAGQGTDTVMAAISRVLEPNVENLVLSGQANVNGTGNNAENSVTGNAGANNLSGLDGNDTINGGDGADTMQGGNGNDTYYVQSAGDIVIELAPGPLTLGVDIATSIDTVIASLTYTLAANVEYLTLAGTTNFNATGNSLDNRLYGNGGANIINGMAGADTLQGGLGNDKLIGGLGKDTMTGGTGVDAFVFNAALSASTNLDTLTDFVHASDKLQLDDDIFTAFSGATAITTAAFRAGAGFTTAGDSSDRIIYNTTTGILYYDADGTGAGSAAIAFAQLGTTTHPALSTADFVVIA